MLILIGIIFFVLAGISFLMDAGRNNLGLVIMGTIFAMIGAIFSFLLAITIPFDHETITIEPMSVLQRNNEIIVMFKSENNDIKTLTDNTAILYNNPSNVIVKALTKINQYKTPLKHKTEYKLISR